MHILIRTIAPLNSEKIVKQLQDLRKNCLIDISHYAVAALVEYKLSDTSYVYISGVNVESCEHNRLSIHAEQNAIVAALTLLGTNAKLSKIWVMGSPEHINAGSIEKIADQNCMMCGHCRQIALSLSIKEAVMHSITVNGKISESFKLIDQLPHAFSERDLSLNINEEKKLSVISNKKALNPISFDEERIQVSDLLKKSLEIRNSDILRYLRMLSPHIINPKFITTSSIACILKIEVNGKNHYVPGILAQDIAFLTTDPIFAALGQAVTRFGGKNVIFQEIYLYGYSLEEIPLSNTEIQLIIKFSNKKNIPIHFYTIDGNLKSYLFFECIEKRMLKMVAESGEINHLISHL